MATTLTLEAAAQEVYSLCKVEIETIKGSVVRKGPDLEAIRNKMTRDALEILRLYDWTFLEVTGTVTTVADVYEYTLTPSGDNPPECEAVLDLLYDVDVATKKKGLPLEHMDWALWRVDPTINPPAASSGRRYTVKGKTTSGTPIIELEWTPAEAGLVMDFRYKVRVDPADPFVYFIPELWSYVVNRALAQFYPYPQKSDEFKTQAATSKAAAIAYAVRKPNDVVRETIDAQTKETNAFLNAMVSDCDSYYS